MKSIRKGNDIQVKWTILRDGLPEDFSGKSLILKLFDDIGYSTIIKDYQVKDNQILFTVFGKDQKSVGIYKATLYENTGIPKMATIDACNLFQLVDCSCKQGGTDDNNITTETVEFTSEFNLSGGFYILTKQEIEEVLTGDILSHNHNTQLKEYLDNNLKTINNESIIGKGNITIEADKSEVEVNDTGVKPTQEDVQVYYNLNDNTPNIEIVPEAPNDNKQYVRQSKQWREPMPVAPLGGYNRALFESLPHVHFNEQTNYYEVWVDDDSGLDNVTEEEMYKIYNVSTSLFGGFNVIGNDARAIIPTRVMGGNVMSIPFPNYLALQSSNVEYIRLHIFNQITDTVTLTQAFDSCSNLRKISGIINIFKIDQWSFRGCSKLQEVKLRVIFNNVDLSYSKLLSYDSLNSIPKYEDARNHIDIKVHPNVYSKLDGSASAQDYLDSGHTREEWMQIVTDASAKNISFAK